MIEKENPKCYSCESKSVIPIFYGYPTTRDYAEYERGNLRFGETIIFGQKPKWYCKKCENKF